MVFTKARVQMNLECAHLSLIWTEKAPDGTAIPVDLATPNEHRHRAPIALT
jgi:hypothetical protein